MLENLFHIKLLIEDNISYSKLVTLSLRILKQHSDGIEELLTITYSLFLEDAFVSGDEKVGNMMQIFKKGHRELTPTMNWGKRQQSLGNLLTEIYDY